MKWKYSGIAMIFSSIGLLGYSCKKGEVINQSKNNFIRSVPFTSDSSALAEPRIDRVTTRALVFDFLPVSKDNQIVRHQY